MGTSQACPGLPKGEHTAKLLLLACCTQEVSQVLRKPLIPDAPRTITVRYQAGPAPGLKFFPDQVYTSVTSEPEAYGKEEIPKNGDSHLPTGTTTAGRTMPNNPKNQTKMETHSPNLTQQTE